MWFREDAGVLRSWNSEFFAVATRTASALAV